MGEANLDWLEVTIFFQATLISGMMNRINICNFLHNILAYAYQNWYYPDIYAHECSSCNVTV